MKKPIALAFSDLHLHKYKNYNQGEKSRFKWGITVFNRVCNRARKLDIPVLFCGDLFHNPKETENGLMGTVSKMIDNQIVTGGVKFIAISGNHDQSEKNTIDHKSPSHLDNFSHLKNFHLLDSGYYADKKMKIMGIPYMWGNYLKEAIENSVDGIDKTKDTNILLLHNDLPGAKTPTGFQLEDTKELKGIYKTLEKWDIVLVGHIHKPQQLSGNTYMLGCPLHLDTGDEGDIKGYWEIYKNGTAEFVEIEAPKFITLGKGEEPKDDFNYYLKTPIEQTEDDELLLGEFSITNKRSKLAKSYVALKQIKSKSKKKALINILNEVE